MSGEEVSREEVSREEVSREEVSGEEGGVMGGGKLRGRAVITRQKRLGAPVMRGVRQHRGLTLAVRDGTPYGFRGMPSSPVQSSAVQPSQLKSNRVKRARRTDCAGRPGRRSISRLRMTCARPNPPRSVCSGLLGPPILQA